MLGKIIKLIKTALETEDHTGTWYQTLEVKDGKRWAFCLAWADCENTNEWELYGKIAYQPKNSIMQCDYDVDWLMPVNEFTGEVDVTETQIQNIEQDVSWFVDTWQHVKETYIDNSFKKLDESLDEFDVKHEYWKKEDGSGNMCSTEDLRRKLLDGAIESLKFLEEFSADKTYQHHVFRIKSLLVTTEQCLSIERERKEN